MTEHEYIRKEYLKAEQFDESREMIEKHSIMSRHGKNDELIPPFFFSTSNRGNVRIHKGNYIVNTYPNNWDVMSSSKLDGVLRRILNWEIKDNDPKSKEGKVANWINDNLDTFVRLWLNKVTYHD